MRIQGHIGKKNLIISSFLNKKNHQVSLQNNFLLIEKKSSVAESKLSKMSSLGKLMVDYWSQVMPHAKRNAKT